MRDAKFSRFHSTVTSSQDYYYYGFPVGGGGRGGGDGGYPAEYPYGNGGQNPYPGGSYNYRAGNRYFGGKAKGKKSVLKRLFREIKF